MAKQKDDGTREWVRELLDVLRHVEWSGHLMICPACHISVFDKDGQHWSGCCLKAALDGSKRVAGKAEGK